MDSNDIVVSGMSCRLPESSNLNEFWKNLINGMDMVTDKLDRWPKDIYGIVNRMGRIPNFQDFDGNYFGLADYTDNPISPCGRLILEATHEAIIDSGTNSQSIRGTNTGVYMGSSHYPMSEGIMEELQPDWNAHKEGLLYGMLLNAKALIPNRISFTFDFKGPSLYTDTACSSSLTALTLAVNDILLGRIDQAIVGGYHMTLEPQVLQKEQECGLCSPRGISGVLDESADGFVKADGVVVVFIQKRHLARRVYSTILSARMNTDGYKKNGHFFPSSTSQETLMVETYKDARVDPLKLTYLEGHLTGTKVGDFEEIKAIHNSYCVVPGRKEKLIMGCLKGNIGHTEGASGLAALIKVCLAFENESLPPNISIKNIKHEIKEFCPPLYPNTEIIKYKPGLSGINNFGIGGVNVHVLVEPNYKLFTIDNLRVVEEIPRIVNICGRTEEAVNHIFDFIENNRDKVTRDFLALLNNAMKYTPNINSPGFPFRGSIIIKKAIENKWEIKYDYKRQVIMNKNKINRPIWFLFPGLGGQWTAMAKALMAIEIFRNKVEECHQVLIEFGVDLKQLLLSEDTTLISTMTSKFCVTTAIEIALFEILKLLDITPDGIIGHSFGEIACAYADGCLTAKEAMITTYLRGAITESNERMPKGMMAVCGISKTEAIKYISNGVTIACYNGKNNVVLSGPKTAMIDVMNKLKASNIFQHQLESSDIAYHHPFLTTCAQQMLKGIRKYIPSPKLRSKKWISTSVATDLSKDDPLNYASAEYFVHNLISPVYFYDQIQSIPSDAIVVEVGPHGVFRQIITESLDSVTYMTLIKKDSNDTNIDNILSAIAKLYELGFNPSIENLYPKVEYPVSRSTASIGSLMRWDHSKKVHDKLYPEHCTRSTASDMNVCIDMKSNDHLFYSGHCIDGNILFPATGYLCLAWRIYAGTLGKIWCDVPVVFVNVQFKCPVFLSFEEQTKLKVVYSRKTGDFKIFENENECVHGKVGGPIENSLFNQNLLSEKQNSIIENEIIISKEDIYKDFRVRGYDYSGEFKKLIEVKTNDFIEFNSICEWDGNIVTFLDNLLQIQILSLPMRMLMVPVMIKQLRINPKVFFKALKQNKLVENSIIEDNLDKSRKTLTNQINLSENDFQNNVNDMRFCHFNSNLPIYYNSKTTILVCPGVEVEQMVASSIPRKLQSRTNLDSYEFVANIDEEAIDPQWKTYIAEYLEVCKYIAEGKNNILPEVMEKHEKEDERKIILKFLRKFKLKDEKFNNSNLQIDNELRDFDFSYDIVNQISKNDHMIRTLIDIFCENRTDKHGNMVKEHRVTEINPTADILANHIEPYITNFFLVPFSVDYKIIVKSIVKVSEDLKNKAIEWDAKDIAQCANSDLIIFRDSPELWNLDLDKFINQLNDSMDENSFLIIIARYKLTQPEEKITKTKTNNVINTSFLEKRFNNLMKTLYKTKLKLIARKSDLISTMAIMLRKVDKKVKIPDKNDIIEVRMERDEKWFEQIKDKLIIQFMNVKEDERVWLIANDTNINGIIGLTNCLRLEPGGEKFRCIFDVDGKIKLPIDWTSKLFMEIHANDLVINVIKDGKLGTYRHLKVPNYNYKVSSRDYFLNMVKSNDLSSLTWYDKNALASSECAVDWAGRSIDLVPIKIYTSGLIFKDVLMATGRIPSGEIGLFTDCMFGTEFAGRRADTGERVMGMTPSRAFATSIDANNDLITPIPEHWSMDEAVTVLSTYFTLWYGLIKRGGLSKSERVLIHSGAGGIGQSAINICKHFECDIFVTVGTEEKKEFIIKEYNINENKIFSSRDIQFKYKIMQLTNGKGVDIVINSLTDEKLDASCDILAVSGRFIEIGKFDMFNNKQLSMFTFLKNISFIAVSLDLELFQNPDSAKEFFNWMHENSNNGCVKPYNRIVFSANEAEKAFRYMTTGRHIGKIVIRIRDEERDRQLIGAIEPAPEMLVTKKTYFNPNKVYIIIGGLGGMGLELVHWMISLNARKFIITSRNGIKTDYQKFVINRLKMFGNEQKFFNISIDILINDCSTLDNTKQVVTKASELGQIGGIFHLGLVLNDFLLEKLSFDKFCKSIDCKYRVFDNLDKLSRNLNYLLDYFVIFSSMACGKGNAGQTNYAFGNSLCERICEQRRREGLHGLAIQYGPVGDVGVFESSNQIVMMSTFESQRINSCFDVLAKLLTVNHPVVTSWIMADQINTNNEIQGGIISNLWKALGIDPETTPDHLTLGDIGIESMFAVELQKGLQKNYNLKISINFIKNITVGLLKDHQKGKDTMKVFLDKIIICCDKLCSYNFTLPKETHTRLNHVIKGKPIYILPTMEISFSEFEEFAQKFSRPVIGLNWTRDLSRFEKMEEIIQYFTDLLKNLEPKGNYDLIGCLDGALIIRKQLLKGMLGRAVIIDSDFKSFDKNTTDQDALELFLELFIVDLPEILKDRIKRDILSESNTSIKIKRMVTNFKELSGRGFIASDLEEVIEIFIKRARLLSEYRRKKLDKFDNKLKNKIGKKLPKLHVITTLEISQNNDKDYLENKYFLSNIEESNDWICIEIVDNIMFANTMDAIKEKIYEIYEV